MSRVWVAAPEKGSMAEKESEISVGIASIVVCTAHYTENQIPLGSGVALGPLIPAGAGIRSGQVSLG